MLKPHEPDSFSLHIGKGALRYGMDFTIQYFGTYDQLLHLESVEADELVDALERARTVIRKPPTLEGDLQPIGYVILDERGQQVARGYRRDP